MCTRCTSQWAFFGLVTGVLMFYTIDLSTWVWTTVLFFLPLPAFVDWVTQSWELRESTTTIRIVTGSSLGLGYALELRALIELDVIRALLGAAVYCTYMVALMAALKIKPISSDVFG